MGSDADISRSVETSREVEYILHISKMFCFVVFESLLTHCGLGDFNEIVDEYFSSQLQWLMAETHAVKLLSEECH